MDDEGGTPANCSTNVNQNEVVRGLVRLNPELARRE